MPAPTEADRDRLRLRLILEIAERLRSRVERLTRDQFVNDRDEIDLAAFRLASIAEYAHKLSPEMKARHPQVGWRPAYDMRNLIAHNYEGIVADRIWDTLGAPLRDLVGACAAELEARDP